MLILILFASEITVFENKLLLNKTVSSIHLSGNLKNDESTYYANEYIYPEPQQLIFGLTMKYSFFCSAYFRNKFILSQYQGFLKED